MRSNLYPYFPDEENKAKEVKMNMRAYCLANDRFNISTEVCLTPVSFLLFLPFEFLTHGARWDGRDPMCCRWGH